MIIYLDFKTVRRAHIYVREVKAGSIEKLATDDFRFRYDETYVEAARSSLSHHPPISLTMPFTSLEYRDQSLPPFFDNLIVEGWLQERVGMALKIDKTDRFALLMASGRRLAGEFLTVHRNRKNKLARNCRRPTFLQPQNSTDFLFQLRKKTIATQRPSRRRLGPNAVTLFPRFMSVKLHYY